MLTGKWVTADDGVLVMQWTALEPNQELEHEREEMTIAA